MTRNTALSLGVAFVFVALCAIMLAILPSPLGPKDYLVAGAVSTILCLLLVWFLFERLKNPARNNATSTTSAAKAPTEHNED